VCVCTKGALGNYEVSTKENINMATLSYSVTEPALRSPVEEWQPHAKQSESVSNNLIKKNAGGILLTDENNSNHEQSG
jgi:hypothetical protein